QLAWHLTFKQIYAWNFNSLQAWALHPINSWQRLQPRLEKKVTRLKICLPLDSQWCLQGKKQSFYLHFQQTCFGVLGQKRMQDYLSLVSKRLGILPIGLKKN